jgi:23S rRNA pseudouridine1911/1915/1917 synthase
MKTKKSLQFHQNNPKRLDKFLAEELNITRSKAVELIRGSFVWVDDQIVKPSIMLHNDAIITIQLEEMGEDSIQEENIPLNILFEDQNFLIVNKPRGMLTHPAGRTKTGTLVNALMYHTKNLSSHYGIERAGIVHRIDKDTTGILIVTKNDKTHQYFADLFQKHAIEKYYTTLVHGVFPQEKAKILLPIEKDPKNRKVKISPNGKIASSEVIVKERFPNHTLLEVRIHTGRTHQIRIHLSHIGFPIVGDLVYGSKDTKLEGQLLHSTKLIFLHPTTGEIVIFECPLPVDFLDYLTKLRNMTYTNCV